MSEFVSILETLSKAQRSPELLNSLLAIRKRVDWPKQMDNINKLLENGCLKHIISALQSKHKTIVDVSLSILGNCCMELECVKQMKRYGILSVLHQLLERYGTREDSVIGRILRIIGNLCQRKEGWALKIIEEKPEIITHIVEVLKLASSDDCHLSEATITMGVRSFREMVSSQTLMKLKTRGVLESLGTILIRYTTLWKNDKRHEDLLCNILRTLHEFSKYNCYDLITELKNTDKGDALICLSDVLPLAPKKVVKITMNLLQMSKLHSDLPVPEICDGFMRILQDCEFMDKFHGQYIEYIECLCFLFYHPANRNGDRCGKSVPLLVETLKNFKSCSNTTVKCSIMIILTLNKCGYNTDLMMLQLKSNIVKVLIKKLEWIIGSSPTLNLEHFSIEKMKRSSKSIKTAGRKKTRLLFNDFKLVSPSSSDAEDLQVCFSSRDRSPSPGSSSDSDGTVCSWNTSHLYSLPHICNDYDSDDYSPVCSEDDMAEECHEDESSLKGSSPSYDEIEKLEFLGKMPNNTLYLKHELAVEIVKLLRNFLRLDLQNVQLVSFDLLLALVKICILFGGSGSLGQTTLDTIYRLLESHQCLVPLMQTNFIPMIHKLMIVQHDLNCKKCVEYGRIGNTIFKQLTYLIESGVGKGNVAHEILRGDDDLKNQLTLIVPYIATNKCTLNKLFLNCGGLEILMKLLQTETEPRAKSIQALCLLVSRKSGNCSSKKLTCPQHPVLYLIDQHASEKAAFPNVTFKLDDGSVIEINREFLSAKSAYFNALLNGNFKESSESEIALPEVNPRSFKYLLYYLQFDVGTRDTVKLDLDLPTILDVIALSDKYLLAELCVLLTKSVEQFHISSETVPMIYHWSINSGTNFLRTESICFALEANIVDSERLILFSKLFALDCNDELVSDIQRLLTQYLKNIHS